jgi:formiminoglutamase
MEIVKVYTAAEVKKFIRQRQGEEKIGEAVQTGELDWRRSLNESSSRFVLVGIPEDIGVRANYGRAGAATAFKPALDSFLNQQNNFFLNANTVFVLGEVFVDDVMTDSENLSVKNEDDMSALRELVAKIDERVSEVIKTIISLNKIPIIIGGGHNNAYGNIKGASEALQKKINVVNCDPHLDFRPTEGRHSGNGFSYAFEKKYLDKYAVLAMHEQYNNNISVQAFKTHADQLFYTTYEAIFVKKQFDFISATKQCIGFVSGNSVGLEIDLDAITNVPSSAKTSSGLSPTQARQFVHLSATHLEINYFHIAEGAPVLSHIKADNKTGKLIAYLISDFIKAIHEKENQNF